MEVLVPCDQLAERSRRQHHLRREQRAALVDVHQARAQRVLLRVELLPRGGHVSRRLVGLAADRRELIVQRAHQPLRGVGSLVEVRHLGVEIVDAVLEIRRLSLERLALSANPVERVALRAYAIRHLGRRHLAIAGAVQSNSAAQQTSARRARVILREDAGRPRRRCRRIPSRRPKAPRAGRDGCRRRWSENADIAAASASRCTSAPVRACRRGCP